MNEVLLCNESDKEKYIAFNCYNKSEMCFTGSAEEVVVKLNSNLFGDGDGSIGSAVAIDNDHISFFYGDIGSTCEHQIMKCK